MIKIMLSSVIGKCYWTVTCRSVLYINDITDLIQNCDFKLYADDVKLYSVIASMDDVDIMQDCLCQIQSWSNAWQLDI